MTGPDRSDPEFDAMTSRLLRREALRRATREINTASTCGINSVASLITFCCKSGEIGEASSTSARNRWVLCNLATKRLLTVVTRSGAWMRCASTLGRAARQRQMARVIFRIGHARQRRRQQLAVDRHSVGA